MAKKINKVETAWEITARRYVGFIDIMGFKDMVSRWTHDEIYEMMKNIEAAKDLNQNIAWSDEQERFVRSTSYSDSIMLYSKDDSHEAAFAMSATFICRTLRYKTSGHLRKYIDNTEAFLKNFEQEGRRE